MHTSIQSSRCKKASGCTSWFRRGSIRTFILASALCLTATSFAQTSGNDRQDKEYVVTASRIEEEILEAPALVSVISAETIATSGASTLVEVLESAPGVSFRSLASPAQAEIAMRGFGESSFGRVLVLIDGRRLNNPDMQSLSWQSIPLSDIERIEILQGSGSVQYGSGAVAGVVNIVTRRPKHGVSSSVSAGLGTFGTNHQRASLSFGGKVAQVSASLDRSVTEGYRERSGFSSLGGSASLTLDVSPEFGVKASGAYTESSYEMPGALSAVQMTENPRQALNRADEAREKLGTVQAELSWLPSDRVAFSIPVSVVSRRSSVDMNSWYSFNERQGMTLEARPSASYSVDAGRLGLLVAGGVDVVSANLAVQGYDSPTRTSRTHSFVVGQSSIAPRAGLKLALPGIAAVQAGARYDMGLASARNEDRSFDASKSGSAFVHEESLTVTPARGLKLFARHATTFRYPFTDEQASTYYEPFAFNENLEPETGRTVEAGFSFRQGSRQQDGAILEIDGVVYVLDMENEIAYDSSTFRNANMDSTRRLGADVGFSLSPAGFIQVEGTYGYVDACFAAGTNTGKKIPLVPVHSASARLRLRSPFGLEAGPSASFRSDSYQGGDVSNSQSPIPSHLVYGFMARWSAKAGGVKMSLDARVDNLLDLNYATVAYFSQWTGKSAWYPAQGRSFSLGFSIMY